MARKWRIYGGEIAYGWRGNPRIINFVAVVEASGDLSDTNNPPPSLRYCSDIKPDALALSFVIYTLQTTLFNH